VIQEERITEYVATTTIPYSRITIGGINCKTFVTKATSDEPLVKCFLESLFSSLFRGTPGRTLMQILSERIQKFFPFPNRFLIQGATVYRDLLKLAIRNGLYSGLTTQKHFISVLSELYKNPLDEVSKKEIDEIAKDLSREAVRQAPRARANKQSREVEEPSSEEFKKRR
jgi:hypothetical protein